MRSAIVLSAFLLAGCAGNAPMPTSYSHVQPERFPTNAAGQAQLARISHRE